MLADLKDDDLKEVGVASLGHRKKLLAATTSSQPSLQRGLSSVGNTVDVERSSSPGGESPSDEQARFKRNRQNVMKGCLAVLGHDYGIFCDLHELPVTELLLGTKRRR